MSTLWQANEENLSKDILTVSTGSPEQGQGSEDDKEEFLVEQHDDWLGCW